MLLFTGTTDASLISHFSTTDAFEGTSSRSIALPSGFGALFSGVTVAGGTPTNISDVYLLTVIAETSVGDGSSWFDYEWTKCQTPLTNIGGLGCGASLMPAGNYRGGVFLSGGLTGSTYSTACGIFTYDPSLNLPAFSSKTAMPTARAFHGQSALTNGDCLVSGGLSGVATVVSTSAIYRVATNAWNTVVAMKRTRFRHGQVTLTNGKVLVSGGRGPGATGNALNFSEIFDPGDNSWTETGPMAFHRVDHRLFLLPDGRVLAIGGSGYGAGLPALAPLSSCEVFDPQTSIWTLINPMAYARATPAVEFLPALRRFYVTGDDNMTEYMDLDTMVWKKSIAVRPLLRSVPCSISFTNSFGTFMGFVGGTAGGDTDASGGILVPASETAFMGGINRSLVKITSVPSPDTFQFETPNYRGFVSAISEGQSTPHAGPPAGKIIGPFVYDTKAGFGVTGTKKALAITLLAGQQYTTVTLVSSLADPNPAEAYPDEAGYLIFNFGFEDQVGPVKYFGRASETTLVLDSGFQFTSDVPVDSPVVLLKQKSTFVPEAPEEVGSFYTTDSNAGRVAADAMLTEIVATGVTTHREVVYPSDRGLGGEGQPVRDNYKVSDNVSVYGSNDLDEDLIKARNQ